MESGSYRFERFLLDPDNRRLSRDDLPIELNGRYLDALALLVREAGRLVSKDRFLDEVWRGVPVTDEALTQCIKTLRRQLGDDAANPRFIETVPKHGYRFIAPVKLIEGGQHSRTPGSGSRFGGHAPARLAFFRLGGAATIGGGVAGILGGLFYGFAAASRPLQPGTGGASVLLVLLCLTMLVGLIGGAGAGFGIAAAQSGSRQAWWWSVIGGAAGALLVGAVVKLVGLDAFNLLFGRSPGDITGAVEGALLGAAIGLGVGLGGPGSTHPTPRRGMVIAALGGGTAGLLIPLLGGRLMGGSLDLVARRFPDSRLPLDQIGGLFGESGFGPISHIVTGSLEGALFAGCVAGAMIVARERSTGDDLHPATN